MHFMLTLLILLTVSFADHFPANQTTLQPVRPECEYRQDPLGIDEPAPRLSWGLVAKNGSGRQTAYRIMVAGSPENLKDGFGDLWDSGKVKSSRTANIRYSGKGLEAFQECFWKVQVWDEEGRKSAWSEPAFFSVGPLTELDWNADWISSTNTDDASNFPWLRKEFSLVEKPRKAYAYINVLGYA
jgi:alpha-L-rhamnosidase